MYDDTVFTAKNEITAGTCQAIYLWTYKDATESTNIVIDWGDETVKWTNTENAFKGCNDTLRAMVPTTWGGTKEDWVSNKDKLLTNVDNMDMTDLVSTLLQIV